MMFSSSYLLLLFTFFLTEPVSTTTKIEVNNENHPRHLSHNNFSTVLKFDRYEQFDEQQQQQHLGSFSTSGNGGWDSMISSFWNDARKKEENSISNLSSSVVGSQLYPFLLCHLDNTSTNGSERYRLIKEEILKENELSLDFFLNEFPVYNHNFDDDKSLKQQQQLFGACFYGSMTYVIARNIKRDSIVFATPMLANLKIRRGASVTTKNNVKERNNNHQKTSAVSVHLSPGTAKSEKQVLELAHALLHLGQNHMINTPLGDCVDDAQFLSSAFISVSSIDISSFTYELERKKIDSSISNECLVYFIECLAEQPEVLSIERVPKSMLLNDYAQWIIQSSEVDNRPWFDLGITGEGEVVQILDSGVDESHCYLKDASGEVLLTTDYDLTGRIDLTKRKVVQYVAINSFNGDRADRTSHGTHVAVTLAGKRSDDGVTETDGMVDGIAYDAKIAFFDAHNDPVDDSLAIPSDVSLLFYFGRKVGARLHGASWGASVNGEYTERVRNIDAYFHNDRDDEFIMFAAAGNDGLEGSGTVIDPSLAKNVISVGASHSFGDDLANSMLGMDYVAAFSSRGPTADNRIKPDLLAPGHSILSGLAHSGDECDPDARPQFDANDKEHGGVTFMSGTSMACPVATGAGALVRQYFREVYDPPMDISGTLLKAVLVNGGEALVGRSTSVYGPGSVVSIQYDEYQAFGRLNLLNSLKHPDIDSPELYVEDGRLLLQGQTHEYEFNVCDTREFRVTIAWKDPPNGSAGCQKCLVNDLDLAVEFNDEVYHPNGRGEKDSTNNVERVILDGSSISGSSNNIFVKVKASNLGFGLLQRYSLASTGCINSVEFVTPTPSPTTSCGEDEFEYVLELFTDRQPEDTSWILEYQGSGGIVDVGVAGYYDKRLNSYIETGCARYDCFLFLIRDSKFDGLCCSRGMGSYQITSGNEVLVEGDAFYDRQEIEKFCYYGSFTEDPTSSPTIVCNDDEFKYQIDIQTDQFPDETRWELRSPQIDGVRRGFYTENFKENVHSGCLDLGGCFNFLWKNGLGYKIMVDDVVLAESDEDSDEGTETFCYSGAEMSSFTTSSSTISCGDGQYRYQITIKTDDNPYNTWWELYSADNIDSVPFMTYQKQLESYSHTGCAKSDNCYELRIFDKQPDGLCCYFGNGYYKLSVGDDVLITVDQFGEDYEYYVGFWRDPDYYSIKKEFCYPVDPTVTVSPTSNPIKTMCGDDQFEYRIRVRTDFWPQDISWNFTYSDDRDAIENVEKGKYFIEHYENTHRGCASLDDCFVFSITSGTNTGLCCFWGNGGYTVFADDIVMADGGQFANGLYGSYEETKTFCYGPSYSFYPSLQLTALPSLIPTTSLGPSAQPTTKPSLTPTSTETDFPTTKNYVCENGSNSGDWCGYYASIGFCDDTVNQELMLENCAKACANCCMDFHDNCNFWASNDYCTSTALFEGYYYFTWQDFMQGECRATCDTCGLFISSPTAEPTSLSIGDIDSDSEFQYEIVFTAVDTMWSKWYLHYKYPIFDSYGFYDSYGIIDYFDGVIPQNSEKRSYGIAKYQCFRLKVERVYLKMFDINTGDLIAQNTELWQNLRFCHYAPKPTSLPNNPLKEAIFTTLAFSASSLNEDENVSNVLHRSIEKILFRAKESEINPITKVEYRFCEEFKCDISFGVCNGFCEDEEVLEPDILAFIANTMNEVLANGQLLLILKQTGHYMDAVIFEDLTDNIIIEFDFEYETWPTTLPTTSPSFTPTQDCNTPFFIRNLFDFITGIFRPVTQAITNATSSISDVLFGVSAYNSTNTMCKDKMFELQIEIQTDSSPGKTSWELLYENGTIIDSIGRDTYTESDTTYNHTYCLDTSCFIFELFDSVAFQGTYSIKADETVLVQKDGFIGWKNTKRFCYPQCEDDEMFPLQIELITDPWPHEISWQLAFANGTLVDSVEERYYTGPNTFYSHRYCLHDGCYSITFQDHMGDGMCCSYGEGSYTIKINDEVIELGGEFEAIATANFCHPCEECVANSLINKIANILTKSTRNL